MNYRRHAGRNPGGDRIMVITDSDGDGKADKSHVFVQEKELACPDPISLVCSFLLRLLLHVLKKVIRDRARAERGKGEGAPTESRKQTTHHCVTPQVRLQT